MPKTHQIVWKQSSTEPWSRQRNSFNHALVTWSWLVKQTWVSIFLGIKNTKVRAYRTYPVQVRSWGLYFIVISHIGCVGEQRILYKGLDTFTIMTHFKNCEGRALRAC
ncbi:hypothetical protein Hanom_Chr07g00624021 [Helianthus anomalus]